MPLSLYGVGSVTLLPQPWVTADLEHLLQEAAQNWIPRSQPGCHSPYSQAPTSSPPWPFCILCRAGAHHCPCRVLSGPSMTLYWWLQTWSGCGWTAAIRLEGNILFPFPGRPRLSWAQHLLNINHWNLPFVMLFVSQPCWIKQETAMGLHVFERINRYPAFERINRYLDIYFKWKPKMCCCYWVFLF